MSNARKYREKPEVPRALVCGMLEDNGRFLFLVRKDQHGVERLELPWIYSYQTSDPVSQLGEAFKKQTGIDCEVGEIRMEGRHNAGSRRRKRWISSYGFSVSAKSMKADPSGEFSGFKWLSLKEAKGKKLARAAEWLLRV